MPSPRGLGARRAAESLSLPEVEPIVPVERPTAFNDPAWLFEPKYDGFRGARLPDAGRLHHPLEAGQHVQALRITLHVTPGASGGSDCFLRDSSPVRSAAGIPSGATPVPAPPAVR